MNRRKFLKWFGFGVAATTIPNKLIALSDNINEEIRLYPQTILLDQRSRYDRKKKPRVLSEEELFDFLNHFDVELKEPMHQPQSTTSADKWSLADLKKFHKKAVEQGLKPLKVNHIK